MGHENTIAYEKWPEFDEGKCGEDTFEYAVQVNSKIKARINIPVDMPNAEIEAILNNEDNDEYIARIARDKLGYVSPGERVFVDISSK